MSTMNWLDLSSTSNNYIQSYVNGFVDISGGDFTMRNNHVFIQAGDISLNRRLFATNDASLNARLLIQSDLSLNQKLFVTGESTFTVAPVMSGQNISSLLASSFVGLAKTDGLDLSTNQTINGEKTVTSTLITNNIVSMNGGNLTVLSTSRMGGDVSMNSNLSIGSDLSINQRLFVSGSATSLFATPPIMSGQNIAIGSISQSAIGNGGIQLTGLDLSTNTTVGGQKTFSNVLTVNSDVSFNQKLFVKNNLFVAKTTTTTSIISPNTTAATAASWTVSGITYTASSSSIFMAPYHPYTAFDANLIQPNKWVSSTNYSTSTGAYTGTTGGVFSTVITGQSTVNSDWLQLQISSPCTMTQYFLGCSDTTNRMPKTFWIVGANTASPTSWDPIQFVTNATGSNPYANNTNGATIVANVAGTQSTNYSTTTYGYSNTAYTYFRMVILVNWIGSSNLTEVGEWNITFSSTVTNTQNTLAVIGSNVGIGTIAPMSALEIRNGTIKTNSDMIINGLTVGSGLNRTITNTAFGFQALTANTNVNNTAIGYQTLKSNTTGSANTAMGGSSLSSNVDGSNNTAVGFYSLFANTSGSANTVFGQNAAMANTTGSNNTVIGQSAFIANTTGSNNTAIGTNAFLTGNYTQSTAIGYGSQPTGNYQVILGTSAESVIVPGKFGTNASYIMDISGTTNITGKWLNQTGDVSLNAKLLIGGSDVSLGGNLYIAQPIIRTSDVSMNSRLLVGSDLSINGNITAYGISGIGTMGFVTIGKITFGAGAVVTPNTTSSVITSTSWSNNGITWTTSRSSSFAGNDYGAFQTNGTQGWLSDAFYNNTSPGAYNSTASTVIQGGVGTILGEWLQLQSSSPVVMNTYYFTSQSNGNNNVGLLPYKYYIIGSTDGSTWYPIQFTTFTSLPVASATSTAGQSTGTYTISTSSGTQLAASITGYSTSLNTYTYFRIVTTNILANAYGITSSNPNRVNFLVNIQFNTGGIPQNILVLNDLSVNGRMGVGKDANLNGNLVVSKQNAVLMSDASLNSRLFVGGSDVSLNGNVFVARRTLFSQDVSITNNATLNQMNLLQDLSLNRNLLIGTTANTTINGNVLVQGNLFVQQASNNNMIYTSSVTNYQLIVSEDISLNGRLFVSDDVLLGKRLYLPGDTSANKTVIVVSDISMGGRLYVSSTGLFQTDLSVNGNLYTQYGSESIPFSAIQSNPINMTSNQTVTANKTFTSTLVVQDMSINGNQNLLHNVNIQSSALPYTVPASSFTLNVVGEKGINCGRVVQFNESTDSINTPGGIYTNVLTANSGIIIPSNTSLVTSGNTSLIGAITDPIVYLNNRLFVGGENMVMNDNLYVDKTTSFGQDLSAASMNMLGSDASLGMRLFVTQNAVMQSDLSVNSGVVVKSDVSGAASLFVKSKTVIAQDLSVNGLVSIGSDVFLNKLVSSNNQAFYLSQDLSLNGSLLLGDNSDISLNSSFYLKNRLILLQDLSVNNRFNTGSDVSLNGNLWIQGNLLVRQGGAINFINTTINNYTFTVSEDISLNGRAYIQNDCSFGSRLYVAGDGLLNQNVSIATDLTVKGNLTLPIDMSFGNNAPVMSGANITADSIPLSALVGGALPAGMDISTNQTVGGVKRFTSPPIMNGSKIAAGSISSNAIIGGVGTPAIINTVYKYTTDEANKKSIISYMDQFTIIKTSDITATIDGISRIGDTVCRFGQANPSRWVAVGAFTFQIAYSNDGINWTNVPGIFTAGQGRGIGWGGNKWVAAGYGSNTLAWSYDGITWNGLGVTSPTTPFTTSGWNAKWNGTIWVAGGQGTNTLAYSYDGIVWTGIGVAIFSTHCQCVAWNGKIWVAGGSGTNSLAWSNDGITWTGLGVGTFNTCTGVAWSGSRWVAVGQGTTNSIAWSDNGTTWTGVTAKTIFSTNGNAVVWNGQMFVAVGGDTTFSIAYSRDGITWTGVPNSLSIFTTFGNGISWDGRMFVAVGEGLGNINAYSYDGINWTGLGRTILGDGGRGVTWNGTRDHTITFPKDTLVAVGDTTNTIAYSLDGGITWIGLGMIIFTAAYGVAWNGTMWIACGTGSNSLAYSYNGITWTGLGLNIFTTRAMCVVWIGNKWVATGQGLNTIAYSYDGLTWIGCGATVITISGLGVAWNGKQCLALGFGTNAVAYSSDGITWQAAVDTSAKFGQVSRAAWNGNLWACVAGVPNTLGYSYDGINWIGLGKVIFPNYGFGIAWNGSRFVAVGYAGSANNSIAYSNDGINWIGLGFSTFSGQALGITWTGQRFVVVGNGTNTIAYSANGLTWIGLGTSIFGAGNGIEVASNMSDGCSIGSVYIQHPTIALGQGTANTLAYSSDGTVWSGLGKTIFSTGGNAVAWNGTMWVAVGQGTNTLAWSNDGITWTGLGTTIFSTQGKGIIWNGSRWIAVGSGTNTIAYSTTGKTWTAVTNSTSVFSTQGCAVAWNGTMLVAVGQGTNSIAYSTNNGDTWTGATSSTTIFTTQGNGIAWNGSRWAAVGQGGNTIAFSNNGIAWTAKGVTTFATQGNGVTWNGVRFVAVGSGTNTIAYSTDANTWTAVTSSTSIFSTQGFGVTWNGKQFIAVGSGTNTVAYSQNGITWRGVPNSTTLFSVQGNGINSNSNVGAVIVDSQLVLSKNNVQGTQNLEILSESYYQNGYNEMTITIQSNKLY